jgi:hypothetical protein
MCACSYEGSDETQSNCVPAWLPTGESLIARHLRTPDSAHHTPSTGGTDRQDRHLENYRYGA